MKKFFTKIPPFLESKLQLAGSNELEVAVIIKLTESEISSGIYKKVGISLNSENELQLNSVIPVATVGRYSKKNITGYTEVHRDRPKVVKRINLGDRPIFGDWSKGSYTLIVNRKVFDKTTYAPKNWSISSELIKSEEENSEKYYILKVFVQSTFTKGSLRFNKDLLDAINLLWESLGKVDLFELSAIELDYLTAVSVDWEIFPPGTRESDINRIVGNRIKLSLDEQKTFANRYDFLLSFNPKRIVKGLGGSNAYFGMIFSDDLVVFENVRYGNAIYVLHENWKELSKLSRSEIISGQFQYSRIIHSTDWKTNLTYAIKGRSAA